MRILDPASATTLSILPMDGNEAAVSISTGKFSNSPDDVTYVAVGAVKDYQLNPKACRLAVQPCTDAACRSSARLR